MPGKINQNVERPAAKGKHDAIPPKDSLANRERKGAKLQLSVNVIASHGFQHGSRTFRDAHLTMQRSARTLDSGLLRLSHHIAPKLASSVPRAPCPERSQAQTGAALGIKRPQILEHSLMTEEYAQCFGPPVKCPRVSVNWYIARRSSAGIRPVDEDGATVGPGLPSERSGAPSSDFRRAPIRQESLLSQIPAPTATRSRKEAKLRSFRASRYDRQR